MKILAGVSAHDVHWESLLRSEGIPYRIVDLAVGEDPSEVSVVVVPRSLGSREAEGLQSYLRRGGAVLGAARHLSCLPGVSTRREPLEYIISDGDEIFRSVWLLDLALQGDVAREANHLRTHQNTFAVFAGELLGGVAVLLPFDVGEALSDERALAKAFYGRRERLPSERVSLVAKGEVQHLVHDALVHLHRARSIPYAHLWYHPGQAKSVFAFRVDTDAATRAEVDVLYGSIRQAGLQATWFVDVHSHEPWIQHFSTMTGQEIGVHCYDHVVYEDQKTVMQQLDRARKVLHAVGLTPEGFAAPYGIWNPGLAVAIERMGFAYSSEFGFVYDALPLNVATRVTLNAAPQIPVHPVSIGSLLRVGYHADEMTEYYDRVVRTKLARNELLFFYHHPGHHHIDVVEHLFASAGAEGVVNMTMIEYARWWFSRCAASLCFEVQGTELRVESASHLSEHNLALRISLIDGKEATVLPARTIDLETLRTEPPSTSRPPADLRRIRETDPRRMLGDLYNAMLRRLR
jgi:hypothetical protein